MHPKLTLSNYSCLTAAALFLSGCVSVPVVGGYRSPNLPPSQAAVVTASQKAIQQVDGLQVPVVVGFGNYVPTQKLVLSPGKHVIESESVQAVKSDLTGIGQLTVGGEFRFQHNFEAGHEYVVLDGKLLDRTTAKVVASTSADGSAAVIRDAKFDARAFSAIGLEIQDARGKSASASDQESLNKLFTTRLTKRGYSVQTPPGDAPVLLRVTLSTPKHSVSGLTGSAEVVDRKTGHVYWKNAGIRVSDEANPAAGGGILQAVVVVATAGPQERAHFADVVVGAAFPAKQ